MPKATSSKIKKPADPKKPKRTAKDIPDSEKQKESVSKDVEISELMKLRPHLPKHDASHQVAEDMKKRKDSGLREWIAIDPYSQRRKTVVDYMISMRLCCLTSVQL